MWYYIRRNNTQPTKGAKAMIDLNELKPILEELLDGREDSADYIERVAGLDKEVTIDRSEIDALNASWNDRFKKAFFGEKGADINEEIPSVDEVKTEEEVVDENYDGEDLKYEGLFTEVKEEKEEE